MISLQFWGAAQTVTGSMHLLEVNDNKFLLDCGLFQGHRAETYERNLHFPFDPVNIDAVILSHAHIDHSGNLPNLVKQGFGGTVWTTAATRDLCGAMLLDSGHIQEADVAYLNKKRARKGEPPVPPLYTRQDAINTLPSFVGVGYERTMFVADGVKVTFYDAGHILGSAIVEIDIIDHADNDRHLKIVFSGDLGREEMTILRAPTFRSAADYVLTESTYGNRLHSSVQEGEKILEAVINATYEHHGKVIIPSFAVGRTQELVYALHRLTNAKRIPDIPIYVDSPLAVNATEIFRLHPEDYNSELRAFAAETRNHDPFGFERLHYIRNVEESKALNNSHDPMVIISASGMCEAGRILHHLKNNIEDAHNCVLFVGYQAENTLGRRIVDGEKKVRIFGEPYRVRARVYKVDGYSAHADRKGLLDWADHFDRKQVKKYFVVHGEPESAKALADGLRDLSFHDVVVPARGDTFTL